MGGQIQAACQALGVTSTSHAKVPKMTCALATAHSMG